jgi:hypothetical protein
MNFSSVSLEKFRTLEPQTVANYLRDSRWREEEVVDRHHSIWTFQHPSEGEYNLLLPLNPQIPDFPNRMYDVVQVVAAVEKRSEGELLNDFVSAAQLAHEKNREVLNLHLDFPHEYVQPEASAKKLGVLLATLQDTLDAIGQFESGRAVATGKISREITDQTHLDVIGIFKGSFGIRLATTQQPEQLDLLKPPFTETVIDDFINLIHSTSDEEKLRELMLKFQQRSASRYRKFLMALTHIEADFRVEWGSPNPNKGGSADLSCLDAWQAIEICDEMETAAPEDYEVIGKLFAVDTEQKTFRMKDLSEGKIYYGKISDDVLTGEVEIIVKPPMTYKATIQETLSEKLATGEVSHVYKLLSLEPWNKPKPSRQKSNPKNRADVGSAA